MLIEQTLERLRSLRLGAMADRLGQWAAEPRSPDVTAEDVVGLLADAEWTHRQNSRLKNRLRNARMRQQACIEDLRFGGERGLTKGMLKPLAGARWVTAHENVIISGATGVGKSYVACALGNQACREGHTVVYRRARRLFDELMTARADGSAQKLLAKLARASVLIIDDFGTESLDVRERSDLLEIVEDRYQVGSTVFTSQRDPSEWHGVIGDETIGDAICDRIVHNGHRIKLGGPSQRKTHNGLTTEEEGRKGK